ncbi:MAG: hypothetical protein GF408_07665 [Candidatus Omnitrophica bacterium]|nr:hypothetical protein [Candidatus Omnitrophota bacterium]
MKRTLFFATIAVLSVSLLVSTKFLTASIILLGVWAAFLVVFFSVISHKREEAEQERWRIIAAQERVLRSEIDRAVRKAEYKATLEAEMRAVEEERERESRDRMLRQEEEERKAKAVLEAEIRAAHEAEMREARETEIKELKTKLERLENILALRGEDPAANNPAGSGEDTDLSWKEQDDVYKSMLNKKKRS